MLIITSSSFYNPEVLDLFLNKTSRHSLVGIVTVGRSTPEERLRDFTEYEKTILEKGFRELIHIEPQNLNADILEKCNAIVILGGNSRLLFDTLKKEEIPEALIFKANDKNSLVITVSAASMLFAGGNKHCKWIDPVLQIDQGFYPGFDYSGFGLIPDLIVPHVEKFYEINPNLEAELQRIENENNIKIKRMKRMDYIVIEDEIFGMWSDRSDFLSVDDYVREKRKKSCWNI